MPLPPVKGGMYAFILTFGVVWEIVIYCLLRNQSCRYIFYSKQSHTTNKVGKNRYMLRLIKPLSWPY